MLKEKPIIAYAANCRQDTGNCLYPRRIEVSDTETAKEAFCFDCVFAQYTDNYRNASHFLWSNALPFDCDNDHSDKPEDWITAEDIAFLFAGVPHIIHYSRHYMKQKGDKSPRPRFHIIFLIDSMTSEPEYAAMKMSVLAAYPFFDDNAVDSARLFFGTEDPEVIVVDGSITLNQSYPQLAIHLASRASVYTNTCRTGGFTSVKPPVACRGKHPRTPLNAQ